MRAAIFLVLLALAVNGSAHAGTGGFTFTPPRGWIDVSPYAPKAARDAAPLELIAQGEKGGFVFLTHAPARENSGGLAVGLAALLQKRPERITLEFLALATKEATNQAKERGLRPRVIESSLFDIGNVTAARIVIEISSVERSVRSLEYVIPGDKAIGILTFTAPPESFPRYEALFDEAARATKGAREPPTLLDAIAKLVYGIVGVAVIMFAPFWLLRRVRTSKNKTAERLTT